jgi:GrpB-like predicted nucleotidyltransferase (UPF0157 family)
MTHPAPIGICAYSAQWSAWFRDERTILDDVFASDDVRIEHIGSTAVPGLGAKPIVDILVGAVSLSVIEAKIPRLAALDYEYMPEHEAVFPQRRFFAKPRVRPRRFHVHAVERTSVFFKDHVALRDALRADPKLASDYEELKRALATRFGYDREGYTEAKSAFIDSVLAGARNRDPRT